MLMVDYIMAMDSENVRTIFTVKPDNIFLENGLLNESGLLENAAQTCSAIVAKSYFVDENDRRMPQVDVVGFISAIKSVKIHTLPKQGSTITTVAALHSRFDTGSFVTCMMGCRTYSGEELLMEGEINLFIQEMQHEKE